MTHIQDPKHNIQTVYRTILFWTNYQVGKQGINQSLKIGEGVAFNDSYF